MKRVAKERVAPPSRKKELAEATPIYQLKITLKRSNPPIWRRVLVPGDFELDFLHLLIQETMGWSKSHMHNFLIDGDYYGDPSIGEELGFLDECAYRLQEIAPRPRKKFVYEYDFGDDWEHEVTVEKILPREPEGIYPICVGGEKACPPEDCGGVWGFYAMLKALRDQHHPDHRQYREWMGYDFDPDEFSLRAVNKSLDEVFKRRRLLGV